MIKLFLLALFVSCSHMNEIGTVGNLFSGSGSASSDAWKDLPRSLNDFLYADNSPVMVGRKSQYEYQVDDNLKVIYKDGKCFGPSGKRLDDESLCKEVSDLVKRVKTTRTELMDLHAKKISAKSNDYYQGTVSEAISGCTSDLEALREGESISDRLGQIRQCRPFLTTYLQSLIKKSDGIRKHPRATDLGLQQFDAFYFLDSGNNEEKVRLALNMTTKEKETALKAKMKSEHDESFWANYCTYLESLSKADEIIENEPYPERKKRLIGEKKGLEVLIPKMREEYKRKNGKPVDDTTCRKYQ